MYISERRDKVLLFLYIQRFLGMIDRISPKIAIWLLRGGIIIAFSSGLIMWITNVSFIIYGVALLCISIGAEVVWTERRYITTVSTGVYGVINIVFGILQIIIPSLRSQEARFIWIRIVLIMLMILGMLMLLEKVIDDIENKIDDKKL